MSNYLRSRALVACLAIALLTACNTKSRADESKTYPVISGVGIALKVEGGDLVVGGVLPDSPAEKCGKIRQGDRLASVEADGKQMSLQGKTVGEAASLIRGPVGTEVVLEIIQPDEGATVSVKLKRAPLGVGTPTYESFIGKPIANLKLSSLDGTSNVRLSDHQGTIIILDFWASWCETCYQPVTKLHAIAAERPEWADRVEIITVTVDADLSSAADTIRKQKWDKTRNLAVDLDDLKAIGVSVVPVAIIISPPLRNLWVDFQWKGSLDPVFSGFSSGFCPPQIRCSILMGCLGR